MWQSTMEGSTLQSRIAAVLLVAVLLSGIVLLIRAVSKPPAAPSAVCARAYARARTMADSSVADRIVLSSYRLPGRWTCGDERRYLRIRYGKQDDRSAPEGAP